MPFLPYRPLSYYVQMKTIKNTHLSLKMLIPNTVVSHSESPEAAHLPRWIRLQINANSVLHYGFSSSDKHIFGKDVTNSIVQSISSFELQADPRWREEILCIVRGQ